MGCKQAKENVLLQQSETSQMKKENQQEILKHTETIDKIQASILTSSKERDVLLSTLQTLNVNKNELESNLLELTSSVLLEEQKNQAIQQKQKTLESTFNIESKKWIENKKENEKENKKLQKIHTVLTEEIHQLKEEQGNLIEKN